MAPKKGRTYTGDWYEQRNARRRERYANDREYRAKANKAARDGYRNSRSPANANEPFDPRLNIDMLSPGNPQCVGKLRNIKGREAVGPVMTFTKAELALVFDRPVKQIQNWCTDFRIPNTIWEGKATTERNWSHVYTVAEAKALVNALGPHLAELIYLRRDNQPAIDAARAALVQVRKKGML